MRPRQAPETQRPAWPEGVGPRQAPRHSVRPGPCEAQPAGAVAPSHVSLHHVWELLAVGGEGVADHFSAVTVHGPTDLL